MKNLEAIVDWKREWLERHRKAQDIVPLVQRSLEESEWEVATIEECPPEAEWTSASNLEARLEQEYGHLQQTLPMLPDYDPERISGVAASGTAGSQSLYEMVLEMRSWGTPRVLEYVEARTLAYQELQKAHSRPQVVRALLKSRLALPQQSLERFDRASRAYDSVRAGTGTRTAAAVEMRTLLDGVKGDLWNRARQQPGEKMTWEKMAPRLVRRGAEQWELTQLIDQWQTRESLCGRLSTVLKDREGLTEVHLDDLWAQLLDHLKIVLEWIQVV